MVVSLPASHIFLLLLPAFTACRKSLRRLEPELACFHWFSTVRWRDWRVESRQGESRTSPSDGRHLVSTLPLPAVETDMLRSLPRRMWTLEARHSRQRTMMVPAHQLCRRPVYSLWRKRNKLTLKMIMTPWEDLFFVINNLLLGEEPVSPSQLFISKSFKWHFSVDWRFHPSGRNQRGLRSIHTLVLLSHWTKGQPGRFWALVNTGSEVPLVSRYLDR